MDDAFAVELRGVTKRHDSVVAVDDIDLTVRRGEFFSLLGPSGCGKTTTLRLISGFETPTRGEVLIDGKVVNRVPPNRRASNLVFQQLAVFPHMDVFDNVAFGLKVKRLGRDQIRQRVRKMLEVVHLTGLERRRASELSGGQRQRVALARALVNDPAVLLMDEPLGSLDLKLQLRMQEELKSIQRALGATFIYVTHNQAEALAMSDRIAVMNDGRIEQVATTRELYRRPRTSFVASFIGDANLLAGVVKEARAGEVVVAAGGMDVRGRSDAPVKEGEDVIVCLRPEAVHLDHTGGAGVENTCKLKVTDAVFLGATVRYRLALPSGEHLRVEMSSSESDVRPGDEVVACWPATSVHVLGERP